MEGIVVRPLKGEGNTETYSLRAAFYSTLHHYLPPNSRSQNRDASTTDTERQEPGLLEVAPNWKCATYRTLEISPHR